MARILTYTPTYDDMLLPETVASVEAQRFDGELTYVVDDRSLHEGRSMKEVCEKYRDARLMVLEGGYDALLCVEHDMVLPEGCVQTLWNSPGAVVYAAYMLRHNTRVLNLFRKEGDKNLGMSISLYPRELEAARKVGYMEVSGAGFGCTLMRREALERHPFKVYEDNPPDLAFAGECVRSRTLQMGRLDVACLHVDGDTGEILSIDSAHGVTARVLALQDVNVTAGGQSMALKHDRYYSMPVQDALELQRAGYVRITNEADQVSMADAPQGRETATAPETATVKKRTPRKRTTKTPRKTAKSGVSGNSDEAS